MKDRNNLLTSMIVALLAGIVYYLAGADSIEKLAPQFGLVESNSQNKNDIEIVFSPAENNCEDKEFRVENPGKHTVKHVSKKNDGVYEVKIDEVKEFASKTNEPKLKFGDAMELLKNIKTDETSLAKLEGDDNNFEWKVEQDPEVDRPSVAWTDSEKSQSLKSRVKTKIRKVYKIANAAIYLGEGDIMTGKLKSKIKKEAGSKDEDKKTNPVNSTDKKSSDLESINGTFNFILDAKDAPNVNKNSNEVKTPDVNVTVKNSNGVSFITVTTDDHKSDCKKKVKCKKK